MNSSTEESGPPDQYPYEMSDIDTHSSRNDSTATSTLKSGLSYQEQLRRQKIINSMENKDYLLVIASQQNKSVEQVKYQLMLELVNGCD